MTEIEASEITFLDPQFQGCPYHAYKKLRDEAPVYWDEGLGYFVVTRYSTLLSILDDPETFSNIGHVGTSIPSPATPIANKIKATTYTSVPMLVTNDPPQHTEFRRISNRILTRQAMQAMAPKIENSVSHYLGLMQARGGGEFISEFAVPVPIEVIATLIGFPKEMWDKVKIWSNAFMEPYMGGITEEREIECAHLYVERQEYLAEQVNRVRAEGGPPEHLLTGVALARKSDGELFNMPEALSLLEQYMIAGNETTTSALGMLLLTMLENPDLIVQMQIDGNKVVGFIEECLRLVGPAQGDSRIVTRDTTLEGVDIPAGSKVMIRLGAGGRDERVFSNADSFDIDRPLNPTHLGFGRGIHMCQGAPLARLELQTACRALLKCIDKLEIDQDSGGIVKAFSVVHLGLKKLHIKFH